ncbi:hypothetical protein [Arthrobacter sp. H41]|uniref:hypothetical protein n=1 Tax=Arthrobacter sp. H41 TaxID=1312978 RepID=UPI00047ACE74|nr:hypothetical protein [Arthrobacter sp. H41]
MIYLPQGNLLKKSLLAVVLLLALTSCGAAPLTTKNLLTEQLSTEDTCTEADAIVAAAGGESGDEGFQAASDQLGELSESASDPLKDELKVLSEVLEERVEDAEGLEQDPERLAELEEAVATVEEVCGF